MTPIRRILLVGYSLVFLTMSIATAITFPWSVDPLADESLLGEHRRYYERAYAAAGKDTKNNASPDAAPLSAQEQFT